MTEERPSRKVAQLVPRAEVLMARIRELAARSENVAWSNHARERMETRDISVRVAFRVLQVGMIDGAIEPGIRPGEWKVKVVRRMKGNRDVGVVVVVIRNDRLLVKTVEWEDVK